jgi:hypothetical protein
MKSFLAIPLMVLGMTSAAWAQDQTVTVGGASSTLGDATAIVTIDSLPVAHAGPIGVPRSEAAPIAKDSFLLAQAPPKPSLAALSFATPAPAPSPAADPAPAPPYGYNERDYNLEIALGLSVIRFRSSVYEATGVGFHSAAAFFFKDWLAIEAAVSSGFAPTIFADEHVKILTYGAGPKISLGRKRLEPWVHVLGGGIHALPQTALGGKNGFQVTGGVGADYGLNPRLSIRLEGDYVGSHLFSTWQHNYQAIAAAVIHF